MDQIGKWWRGEFGTGEIRVYAGLVTAVFWGLIGICWWLFPDEHHFWVLTHTFSYLGSFDADRNPEGWWLFTLAMCFWAVAAIPMARYLARRLEGPAPVLARRGKGWLVLGCAGIGIVGVFPDAGVTFHGEFGLSDLHNLGAVAVALGFIIGASHFAAIVFRRSAGARLRRARWPHGVFLTVTVVALYFLIRWEFIYYRLKTEADAAGVTVGSSWQEAMNTIYAFPLWDNVFVLAAFVYLIWTALALSAARGDD